MKLFEYVLIREKIGSWQSREDLIFATGDMTAIEQADKLATRYRYEGYLFFLYQIDEGWKTRLVFEDLYNGQIADWINKL